MVAQQSDGTAGENDCGKWSAIFEVTLIMFFIALIPKLIIMDPRYLHWYDFWEPVLSAMLAAGYTYIRARGIKLEENIDE